MTNTEIPSDRLAGSVLGLAFGDSVGDPYEFRKYAEIMKTGGASVPNRLRVTDDTQMSLAVWHALESWTMPKTLGDRDASLAMLRMELLVEFVAWRVDPDNNRAPGGTCMGAVARLDRMGTGYWVHATSPDSAGCGSVMRAPWVGLHPKLSDDMVSRVAMLQAVLTHAPAENAFCAAALADLTRALARDEVAPGEASAFLADWAVEHRGYRYDTAVFSNLWEVARDSHGQRYDSPSDYVSDGCDHVEWVAAHAHALAIALSEDSHGFDPCTIAGEGWRARETVALAVGILDGFIGTCVDFAPATAFAASEALLRAAETNGDSDSIGAVTGALVGAAVGNVWDAELFGRIEPRYRRELSAVISVPVS
jgi:ADP-ribosylglycohydrolase